MRKFLQKTVRIQSLLVALLLVLLLLVAGLFLMRAFWLDQLRAWTRGSVDVAAEKYVQNLPECDRVEIYRLALQSEAKERKPPKQFELWNIAYSVIAEQSLTGREAEELCARWRRVPCYWSWAGLCHEPAYGLRFYTAEKLQFETSFCWKCNNFIVPTPMGHSFCGFDKRSTNALAFWNLLQQRLSLPPRTNNIP
jgi:hypothetical protein